MAEQTRPPIVTILGHVDHGKTTLLDYIRKTAVASREHGGITQAIGAYQAEVDGKLITFIDTPGHAAFEKMRSRGAKVADIAILVVAIDDGLMPQTIEAIKHIHSAKIPVIVAVNKIDIPGVNITTQMEKLKKQLSDQKILIEEYGGDVPIIQLSARTGEGVDKLLEMILLVAEVNEIKGDPSLPARGVIIEARMDKSRGAIATVIIRNGTLKKGQQIVAGSLKGKLRGLMNYAGKMIDSAGPSTPVEILGLETVPDVGAVLGEEKAALIEEKKTVSLIDKLRQEKKAVLNLIVKSDNKGSLEAVIDGLQSLNDEDAEHIKIVSFGTGDINDGDIKMAATSSAIVVGFNSKIVPTATQIAETEGVLVRTYTIIYELLEEMEEVVESMLKVGAIEEIFGTAQIIAEFPYGKDQRIAGCRVVDGVISKGYKTRVVREGEKVGDVKIKSLKKVRDEVNKVDKGDECGMMFDVDPGFQVGDIVQSYRTL